MELDATGEPVPANAFWNLFPRAERQRKDDDSDIDVVGAV